MATANLIKAVVIAVRYSGVRRQFGPENSTEELPVLEYQLQQWRLFPFLAAGYVLSNFSKSFRGDFISMQKQQMAKKDPDRMVCTFVNFPLFSLQILCSGTYSRPLWVLKSTPFLHPPNL
jgi:hypothetical protein